MKSRVAKEIEGADGDVGEAAYWHFKMLTDPTQQPARSSWGHVGQLSEREAFKTAVRRFCKTVCRGCGHPSHGDEPCTADTSSGEVCECEMEAREPGCQCDLEPGDSECPVHDAQVSP